MALRFVWPKAIEGAFITGGGEQLKVRSANGAQVIGTVKMIVETSEEIWFGHLRKDELEIEKGPEARIELALGQDLSEFMKCGPGAYVLVKLDKPDSE